MINPPSLTQRPQITSLDDVAADEYDVPSVVTGSTMTYDSDGSVPPQYVEYYVALQQLLAAFSNVSGSNPITEPLRDQLNELIGELQQYELRLIDCSTWRRVLDIRLTSGTSTPSTNESVTLGASNTQAYQFGVEIGVRAWAEATAGVIFAEAKAGIEISAKVSASLSESYSWTNSTTTTVGAPLFTAAQDCRVLVWQKVANIDIEVRNPSQGTDWTKSSTFSDSSNTFANQVFPAAAAQGAQLAVRQGAVAKPNRMTPHPRPPMTQQQALKHLAALKAKLERTTRAV